MLASKTSRSTTSAGVENAVDGVGSGATTTVRITVRPSPGGYAAANVRIAGPPIRVRLEPARDGDELRDGRRDRRINTGPDAREDGRPEGAGLILDDHLDGNARDIRD